MMSKQDQISEIPIDRSDGTQTSLAEHRGKVVLVVNVASRCGLTPQYKALGAVFRRYRDRGFVVCAFPANDFAGQEPGSDAEIKTFCQTTFGVEFPVYAKIAVTGQKRHPLYSALTASQPEAIGNAKEFRQRLVDFGTAPLDAPEVLWNFEKFLLSREGVPVARFAPNVTPDDPILVQAIERELARA